MSWDIANHAQTHLFIPIGSHNDGKHGSNNQGGSRGRPAFLAGRHHFLQGVFAGKKTRPYGKIRLWWVIF